MPKESSRPSPTRRIFTAGNLVVPGPVVVRGSRGRHLGADFQRAQGWKPESATWKQFSELVTRHLRRVNHRQGWTLRGTRVRVDDEDTGIAAALTAMLQRRPAPRAITVDNGSEFVSRAMDAWAYAHGVRLDFIRPAKPVENAFIESFNGKLRDECLNSHVFVSVAEAQVVLEAWREDYNAVRPHSALQDRTPAAMGALWVDSREPRESTAINEMGVELETTVCSVTFPL